MRLHALCGALCVVLELSERSGNFLQVNVTTIQMKGFLSDVLEDTDLLRQLRSVSGLSAAEEAVLRRVQRALDTPATSESVVWQAASIMRDEARRRARRC